MISVYNYLVYIFYTNSLGNEETFIQHYQSTTWKNAVKAVVVNLPEMTRNNISGWSAFSLTTTEREDFKELAKTPQRRGTVFDLFL
jgi:hypothetical protein